MASMPTAKDKDEYENWFKGADKNNDGFLTTKELKSLFKQRGYKTKSKQFKLHFKALDSDSDKKVSQEEYVAGMERQAGTATGTTPTTPGITPTTPGGPPAPGTATPKGEGDDMLTALKDYVMGMESLPVVEHKDAEMRRKFEEADTDGNGKLDLDEAKVVLRDVNTGLNNKQLFDIMHRADKDGSGFVDFEEFSDLFRKQVGDD